MAKTKNAPAFDPKTATFVNPSEKRETRSATQELRAEAAGDGKIFLVGYTALYNSLSQNLGTTARPWKERIMPGAFTKALTEKQDVRHLKNHDPNYVLGRTKAGTLTLSEDATGLKYRTLLPDTSYAHDLAASVERGDYDEQSFGFVCHKDSWVTENGVDIRQLEQLSLLDISTVAYAAYLGTSAGVEARMFPDGLPDSVSTRMRPQNDKDSGVCECDCGNCGESDCAECTNASCDDANCSNCPAQASAKNAAAKCACDCENCVAEACENCTNTACKDDKCEDCPAQNDVDDIVRPAEMEASIARAQNFRALAGIKHEVRAASNSEGTLELYVYEDIGDGGWFGGGVSAMDIKRQIENAPSHDRIRVRINSYGGDVFDGVAIHNLLRAQGKPIECCVDGIAASAASIVAMAGDKITMGNSAMLMIHNASSGMYGYASDLRKTADVLDKISGAIAQTYAKVTGKSKSYIKDLMDAETWMTAADCIKDGFAHGMTPEPDPDDGEDRALMAVIASRLPVEYRNVPERFRPDTRAKAEAEKRAKELEAEEADRQRLALRRRMALVS